MTTPLNDYIAALNGLAFSDEAKARMAERIAKATSASVETQAAGAAADCTDGCDAPCTTAPSHAEKGQVLVMPTVYSAQNTQAGAAHAAAVAPVADGTPQAGRTSQGRHPRYFSRAALGAVLAASLAVGGTSLAVAAGVLSAPSQIFANIFGSEPAQTEILDTVGHPLDAACTDAGVTLTARAVVGDARNVAVVCDLERTDGEPWGGIDTLDNGRLSLITNYAVKVGGMRNAGAGSYFCDDDPSDDTIQWVVQLSALDAGESLAGKEATIELKDLRTVDANGNAATLAEGDWKLAFELAYEDTTVEVAAGQDVAFVPTSAYMEVDAGEQQARVSSIAVSDLGASVTYRVEGVPAFSGAEDGQCADDDTAEEARFTGMPFEVTFADGTTEDLTDCASSVDYSSGAYSEVTKAGQFSRVVDVSDIVSVTLGTTVVPVG